MQGRAVLAYPESGVARACYKGEPHAASDRSRMTGPALSGAGTAKRKGHSGIGAPREESGRRG